MDGGPPAEEDFDKLTIEDRIKHKNWKARLSGYHALSSLFYATTLLRRTLGKDAKACEYDFCDRNL
ncbi:hypothetical protein BT69DRAFT_1339394 [Atractiella rhizophila]|nr:hypothetical protein BT69DRAFT_1339394 [Atractiella rhizophila]